MEFGSDFVFAPQSAEDEFEMVPRADLEKEIAQRVKSTAAHDDGKVLYAIGSQST